MTLNSNPNPNPNSNPNPNPNPNRPLSRNAETKDFARLTSHPVRG